MLVLLFCSAGKHTTKLTFALKKKKKIIGPAFASLGEEAVFHSHRYAGSTPPHSAQQGWLWHPRWGCGVPSAPPKTVPSSKPHQLPGGHGEDRSIRMRINPWLPDAASRVQTHVLLNLINLIWKSYWEGKGCFNFFNSFPSSLFLLFQQKFSNMLQII